MQVMPEAMRPGENDRVEAMSVIREPPEAGYMAAVVPYQPGDDLHDLPPAPHQEYVHLPTPFLRCPGYEVPYPLLKSARTFCTHERRPGSPHLMGWHDVECPACPVAVRGKHYARPPAGWGLLQVPFRAMVPLQPSEAYLEDRLMLGESMAECYLISEWTVLAAVYGMEKERSMHRLSLSQQGLIDAIRAVGVDLMCTGPNGKKHATAGTLEALLTLAEALPPMSNFEARLQQERPVRRDRGSRVMRGGDRALGRFWGVAPPARPSPPRLVSCAAVGVSWEYS